MLALPVAAYKKENGPRQQHSGIVILHDNDVHCDIDGCAAMAGLGDAIGDTAYLGLVHCGDFLQGGNAGAISNGGYFVDIMRGMHYDAVTLGNHEFDCGVPRMNELMAGFNAPVLCAILFDMQGIGSMPPAPGPPPASRETTANHPHTPAAGSRTQGKTGERAPRQRPIAH